MKIVFASPNIAFFRHSSSVIRYVCRQGHQVHWLFGSYAKAQFKEEIVQTFLAETPGCQVGRLPYRHGIWARVLPFVQELLNYSLYLKPQHTSPALIHKRIQQLPPALRPLLSGRLGRGLLTRRAVVRSLGYLVQSAPPVAEIVEWLRREKPDAVVATTILPTLSLELEAARAACALGIPTLISIASWDNLSTKGAFHGRPDLLFVWNEAMAQEAVQIHGLPRSLIFTAGAPLFDYLFEMKPSLDKAAFLAKVGLPPDRPYIVYLGSSTTITGDESGFVRQLIQRLKSRPQTARLSVLLRPHPFNADCWNDFSAPGVVVWPRRGVIPDTPEARQDYFDTLYHGVAALGVNTSAMIEAAILDRPCVTIFTEQYRATQLGRGHFHHLLQGDFLEIANGFEEAAAILAGVAAGRDLKAAGRRSFVRDFLRPYGIERPASEVFGRALLLAAQRKSAAEIDAAILAAGAPLEAEPARQAGSIDDIAGAHLAASA